MRLRFPSNALNAQSTTRGSRRDEDEPDDVGTSHQTSPEGVSFLSDPFLALALHCPTADKSVVVDERPRFGASRPVEKQVRRSYPGGFVRSSASPRRFVFRSCARRHRPEGRFRRAWIRACDRPRALDRPEPPAMPLVAIRRSRPLADGLALVERGTPKGTASYSHHAGTVFSSPRCLPAVTSSANIPSRGLRRGHEPFSRPSKNSASRTMRS